MALAIVVGFFAVADFLMNDPANFLSARNLRAISAQTATVAIAALGMTVIGFTSAKRDLPGFDHMHDRGALIAKAATLDYLVAATAG